MEGIKAVVLTTNSRPAVTYKPTKHSCIGGSHTQLQKVLNERIFYLG